MTLANTPRSRLDYNGYALSYAQTSSHLTRALVSIAGAAGYAFYRRFVWSDRNRHGVLSVVRDGVELFSTRWDLGNHHRIPVNYYARSKHHDAVLDALQFVIVHAYDNEVAMLFDVHPYGFYLPIYEPDRCFD